MTSVLTLADSRTEWITELLARYGLVLECLPASTDITGSYWGESEAGLLGNRVVVRPDTPLHSILHESSHYVCMSADRRSGLDTNAGGEDLEESGVCYLQILLADHLQGMNRDRMLADMDAWGYSFRLGSARAWFEQDADDARAWLLRERLIDDAKNPTWRLRQ